jgi:hypothetical protein
METFRPQAIPGLDIDIENMQGDAAPRMQQMLLGAMQPACHDIDPFGLVGGSPLPSG